MTVATFVQPDRVAQDSVPSEYAGNIDAAVTVMANVAAAFAPHEAATPNMTVLLDAGTIQYGTTLTSVAQQTTSTITAPVTNPRIDRIVIDGTTGAVSIIPGTEAASPAAPALTFGKIAIAQVLLATSTTAITNSMITDERTHLPGVFQEKTLLQSVSVADGATSVEFKELDNSYDYYTIEIYDLYPKAAQGILSLLLGYGGASPTYYNTNEYFTLIMVMNSSGFTPTANATDNEVTLTSGTQDFDTNYDGWNGVIKLNGVGVTSKYVGITTEIHSVQYSSQYPVRIFHNSYCNSNANVITAVKLITASTATTFSGGTVKLYGHINP